MEKLIHLKDVKQLLNALEDTNGQNYGRVIREFREQLETLSVINITRCKDCIYYNKYNDKSGTCMRECFESKTMYNQDFCGRGYV